MLRYCFRTSTLHLRRRVLALDLPRDLAQQVRLHRELRPCRSRGAGSRSSPAPTPPSIVSGCRNPSRPSVVSGLSVRCGRRSRNIAARRTAFTIRPFPMDGWMFTPVIVTVAASAENVSSSISPLPAPSSVYATTAPICAGSRCFTPKPISSSQVNTMRTGPCGMLRVLHQDARRFHDDREAGLVVGAEQRGAVGGDDRLADQAVQLRVLGDANHLRWCLSGA